jgi:LacI family transcriptional regulator
MTTIKDIAKRSNVAISTVSYVLNKSKNVKPETRKKVLQAIEELNYRPNMTARSLKTKQSLTVGIILPDISNLFFIEVIRGIEDTLSENDYSVILCNSDENKQKEIKYISTLIEKDIDGIIFLGTGTNLTDLKKNVPLVVVDRKLGDQYSTVTTDNEKGGYMATMHLLERNHSEVILLTGPLTISTYFDRKSGYMKALKEKDVQFNELLVHECEVSLKGGMLAVEQVLNSEIEIKSIFAANDLIALGAMRALIKRGFAVPGDVSIIGYDDIPMVSLVTPALTTIEQPKYEMGVKAGELLLQKIRNVKKNEGKTNMQVTLQPKLIIRETTRMAE